MTRRVHFWVWVVWQEGVGDEAKAAPSRAAGDHSGHRSCFRWRKQDDSHSLTWHTISHKSEVFRLPSLGLEGITWFLKETEFLTFFFLLWSRKGSGGRWLLTMWIVEVHRGGDIIKNTLFLICGGGGVSSVVVSVLTQGASWPWRNCQRGC